MTTSTMMPLPSVQVKTPKTTQRKPKIMRSKKQWRKLVSQFKLSGLTQSEFCKQKNIANSTFSKWCKFYADDSPVSNSPTSDFIDLSEPLTSPTSIATDHIEPPWHVELALGDGVVLRIRTY